MSCSNTRPLNGNFVKWVGNHYLFLRWSPESRKIRCDKLRSGSTFGKFSDRKRKIICFTTLFREAFSSKIFSQEESKAVGDEQTYKSIWAKTGNEDEEGRISLVCVVLRGRVSFCQSQVTPFSDFCPYRCLPKRVSDAKMEILKDKIWEPDGCPLVSGAEFHF